LGFIWAPLDESADKERRHVFVVAGYIARQREWTEIERKWQLRLEKEDDPYPMKYFKNSECQRLSGEFARFRDERKYPKPKGKIAANQIRDDLLDILKGAAASGIAVGVLLKDYRAIRKNARARRVLPKDVYLTAYLEIIIQIAGDLRDEMPSTETVAFLVDDHNSAPTLVGLYPELKRHNPLCAVWMGSIMAMDDKRSPALQAADLLASQCKDVLVEMTTTPDDRKLRDTFKERVGRQVRVCYMNKEFLERTVDANVLRDGKPSIGSTQQLKIFRDLLSKTDVITQNS
jgi:hypothetical protein